MILMLSYLIVIFITLLEKYRARVSIPLNSTLVTILMCTATLPLSTT